MIRTFLGEGGGRLLEGWRLLNILSLRRGAYSKGGAYWKLDGYSSIYGNYFYLIINLRTDPRIKWNDKKYLNWENGLRFTH